MSKKNDNDNIETINLTPRKGVIDLSFFDDLTDQLKFKTEICETTRDFVKDALEDAVSRSDIGHVDLSMQDASEFEDGLESDDNRLNGVVYSGEDDKYTYFVSVMMGYDDEMGEDEEEDYSDLEAMLDDDYDDDYTSIVRCYGCAYVIDGKGYIALGQTSSSSLRSNYWIYDPATDLWDGEDLTDFEGSSRVKAVCFSTGKRGIVATGGTGTSSSSFYDDTWELKPYEYEEK